MYVHSRTKTSGSILTSPKADKAEDDAVNIIEMMRRMDTMVPSRNVCRLAHDTKTFIIKKRITKPTLTIRALYRVPWSKCHHNSDI